MRTMLRQKILDSKKGLIKINVDPDEGESIKSENTYKLISNRKSINFEVTVFDDNLGNPLALVLLSDISKIKKFNKQQNLE